jgi:uncharacterized protein YggU (UPF0235/DUF167 family)
LALITVRVRRGSAAERIGPFADGVLALSVTRPPAEGEANEAARKLLARVLGVPPSSVQLSAGARSRIKRFEARTLSDEEAALRLNAYRP